jgi:glycosyltransferase involved in cell wall biosynthesis
MIFHVIGLPHTITSKKYCSCAYTQKVLNFCKMMKSLGHTIYHYGGEESTVECDEHITIISKAQKLKWWGNNDVSKEFYAIDWNPALDYWREANGNAIKEISKRINKKDFICLIGGSCQKEIADAFPAHISVEFGIGYEGIFSKYRVFESYAWMHYVYGLRKIPNGQYYDTVIPNYFGLNDFPFSAKKENYFLFIGRLIKRKGLDIAAEICNRIGVKLIVVGQGIKEYAPGKIVSDEITVTGNVEYQGTVDVKKRGEPMSKAKATFVQTQYIGPFEGVSIESMLCGTPVIVTDWGCFSETVLDGITGYRIRTLGEGIWAAKNIDKLDPNTIRDYAQKRYSIDVVKHRYDEYFRSRLDLWDNG